MPRYCLDCGELAEPGDLFCYYCGAELPGTDVESEATAESPDADCCPDCGERAVATDRFCFFCGRRLETD